MERDFAYLKLESLKRIVHDADNLLENDPKARAKVEAGKVLYLTVTDTGESLDLALEFFAPGELVKQDVGLIRGWHYEQGAE